MSITRIIKETENLLKIPSPIGFENHFLKSLELISKKEGYNTILKKNYLVVKPTKKTNKIFSIHIDRHGLIVNDKKVEYLANYWKNKLKIPYKIDKEIPMHNKIIKLLSQSLKNFKISEDSEKIYIEEKNGIALRYIKEGGKDFFEKIAMRHTGEELIGYDKNMKKVSNYTSIRYDISVKDKLVTFDLNKKINSNVKHLTFNQKLKKDRNKIYGQIDNVISCAIIINLIKRKQLNQEVIFTTQEEIGKSWIPVVDYMKNNSNKLIVLDTSPYENFESKIEGFLVLREGDENGKFEPVLCQEIQKFCKKNKIPTHLKSSLIGMTELGRVSFETQGRINGTTLQLPTINYHTSYETCMVKSLENYMKVISLLNKN